MCNVARAPNFVHTGRSSFRSASVSRVPCRNSIGTVTFARWSARFVPGLFGGCNGKLKNTNPRTPSSKRSAAACEVIRPPMDFRSEEHTSELQSQSNLVCRLLLEKKKTHNDRHRDSQPYASSS